MVAKHLTVKLKNGGTEIIVCISFKIGVAPNGEVALLCNCGGGYLYVVPLSKIENTEFEVRHIWVDEDYPPLFSLF